MPSGAGATVGSCGAGDAPTGYANQACQNVCTESGSELTCEMDTLCPTVGSWATVVTEFGDNDVSAWGECFGGPKFCCVFDDTSDTVTSVELSGTQFDDEALSFVYNLDLPTEENLRPWDDDDIIGYIRGNAGGDLIFGSDYTENDHEDRLYGQNGSDTIFGNRGADFLSGGHHDDGLSGDNGNDTIWGGDGDDAQYGGDGHDWLCDASGYDFCATDQENFMDGGAGLDKLWYEESEDPNQPCPGIRIDPTSTAGTDSDQCGDNSNWSSTAVPPELPGACEVYITVRPAPCEGAN